MNHAMWCPFVPIIIYIFKKLVKLFYHEYTVDGGSVPHVVVDNMKNRVVYDIDDCDLVFFTGTIVFRITTFSPVSDT